MSAITNALTGVIQWIYGLIQNHGWSIVIFTILIRLVLMPLDVSSRKGMRRMAKIQPQLTALQKKYANDRAKLQQKQSELMRREHYNPLSGCLPLLIQMPILFAMFGAMRAVANEKIVEQVFTFLQGGAPQYEGWLWVKNIWEADSLFAPVAPSIGSVQMIGFDVWHSAWVRLSEAQQAGVLANIAQYVPTFTGTLDFSTADALKNSMSAITSAMAQMPLYLEQIAKMPGFEGGLNLFLFRLDVFRQYNGLLILPILAGVTQLVMTKLNPQAAGQAPAAQGQGGMGNFMKYFFPIFSVYICLTSNAAFALYWVTSNVIASAMTYGINIYFDRKEKAGEAQRLEEGAIK